MVGIASVFYVKSTHDMIVDFEQGFLLLAAYLIWGTFGIIGGRVAYLSLRDFKSGIKRGSW